MVKSLTPVVQDVVANAMVNVVTPVALVPVLCVEGVVAFSTMPVQLQQFIHNQMNNNVTEQKHL